MVPFNLGYSVREAGYHFKRNFGSSFGAVITIFLSLFIIGVFAIASIMVNNVVGECAARTYNKLCRMRLEAGSKEAFRTFVAALHQMYLMGIAVELRSLGYHMTKVQ